MKKILLASLVLGLSLTFISSLFTYSAHICYQSYGWPFEFYESKINEEQAINDLDSEMALGQTSCHLEEEERFSFFSLVLNLAFWLIISSLICWVVNKIQRGSKNKPDKETIPRSSEEGE